MGKEKRKKKSKSKKKSKEKEPEIEIDFAAEAVPLTGNLQRELDPLKTGFVWYKPPLASTKEHETGGHTWTITGHDMQILTSTVPAGESVITEVGTFMYMAPFMSTPGEPPKLIATSTP